MRRFCDEIAGKGPIFLNMAAIATILTPASAVALGFLSEEVAFFFFCYASRERRFRARNPKLKQKDGEKLAITIMIPKAWVKIQVFWHGKYL